MRNIFFPHYLSGEPLILLYIIRCGVYKRKTLTLKRTGLMKGGVVPPGIEPGTQGFSVLCSTN